MKGEEILNKFVAAGCPLKVTADPVQFSYRGAPQDERLEQELDDWIEHVYAAATGLCPMEGCRVTLDRRIIGNREYLVCPVDPVHFGDSQPVSAAPAKSIAPINPRALRNARAMAEAAYAEMFLREALADGRQPKVPLLKRARVVGLSAEVLAKARKTLGVKVSKSGCRVFWRLPAKV